MRSYSGCLTCRCRKLKCDEVKPVCGHCTKGSRDCSYTERSVFRNFDLRPQCKRKNKGINTFAEDEVSNFDRSHVWLEIPSQLRFVQIHDPYAQEDLENLESLEDISGLAESDHRDTDLNDISTIGFDQPGSELQNGLDLELNPVPGAPSYPASHLANIIESKIDPNIISLHLVRHFKESPGQWMDLFDTGAYFSSKVPVIAASRPLLKSAACALAAKHLQHIDSNFPGAQLYPNRLNSQGPLVDHHVDWHYQSATYYDQAIGHLKEAIHLQKFDDDISDKEEVFAAVAILCTYELMTAPGTAWRAHLSALPLFSPETNVMSAPCSPVIIPRTAIKGPIFWSLARQDLLCAFISETQTRLDLKDIRLWQNAGLATDEDGFLQPFSPPNSADVRPSADVEEDTKSNELTWLLGKLANHLTSGDALYPEDYALPAGQRPMIGVTQEQLLERWNLLLNELQKWRASLPPTFQASARTKARSHGGKRQSACGVGGGGIFDQIWYDLPLCAATMQSYHMASILLLVNRPQESTAIRSTVSARLKCYRQIQTEVLRHAREVCGISLANPTAPVRINSVQALFVAGQVFHQSPEQNAVLELLSGIETDLGWTTSYHRAKLVDEWARDQDGQSSERSPSEDWMLP